MEFLEATLFSQVFVVTWIAGTIRLAGPVLLAALGENVGELSGVLNIGIEGTMLAGALGAFVTASAFGDPSLALLSGVVVGLTLNLFLAWMYVTVQADQVVVGVVFNGVAIAGTSFAFRAIYGSSGGIQTVSGFPAIQVPLLHKIPILGPSLFTQSVLVYGTIALAFAISYMLFRTRLGLSIRAAGEHPRAADAAGLSVTRLRYIGVLVSGAFAGAAGGYLILTAANVFRDGIVGGKGFIALAIVIFGAWNPIRALGAALVFGAASALQLSLQAAGYTFVPQLMFALPYLLTIAAVSGLFGRRTQPTALLVGYRRS